MSEMSERIRRSEKEIIQIFADSMAVMLGKNRQRGDCWRDSGLVAQFVEIHSMYFRLRNLIWIGTVPDPDSKEWDVWEAQVSNALEDLRNFTMLAELCLLERNIKGGNIDDKLSEKQNQ